MQDNVIYYQKNNHIERIYYKDSVQSYPVHTHTSHMMLGYVMEGAVCVICDGQRCQYHVGENFCIMPDIPHAIETIDNMAYSMMVICISFNRISNPIQKEILALRQLILDAPESVFFIEDMAKNINVSPYHMIRQFKAVCGLTPHRFQIQCRVRRAQKLLQDGKRVVEVAYETGFYDQSHFDRCFRKIVKLTPNEYKSSIIKEW